MGGDVILMLILAVGTAVLNKDVILSDWFSATEEPKDRK